MTRKIVALAAMLVACSCWASCCATDGGTSPGGASTGGASTAGTGGASTGGTGGASTGGTGGAGTGGTGGASTGGTGGSGGSEGPVTHWVAYGDTRSNRGTHQQMLAAIAALDPEAVIHTGDLWDGYGASAWKADVTSHDNLAALLNANKFLVSQGNHETSGEVLGFTPPLVRNGSLTYTASIGNTFVAVLGYSPDPAYLGTALASQESAKATWRVVVSHKPIYSSGSHGADGNAAIETLCDQYQVDLYVAGHDHDYERTEQLRGGAVVDTSNHLKAGAGTVYMVTGGGGAPLYSKSNPVSVSHVFKSVNHLVDIEATSTVMTVRAATVDGTPIDTFTITR